MPVDLDQLSQWIDDLLREISSLKVNNQYHNFHMSLNGSQQELNNCKDKIENFRTQDHPVQVKMMKVDNIIHAKREAIEDIRERVNLPIVLEQLPQKTNILLRKIIALKNNNLYHGFHAILDGEQNELQDYMARINNFIQQHPPVLDEVMKVANKIYDIEERVNNIEEIDLVNRNREQEMFSNPFRCPFYLFLHALKGFGKTKFLLTMKRQLRENECICIHIDFSRAYLYFSIREIANHFSRELGGPSSPPGNVLFPQNPSGNVLSPQDAGLIISRSLIQAINNHQNQRPGRVFILLDSIEFLDQTLSKQFFDQFLAKIQEVLSVDGISLYTICAGAYAYHSKKFSLNFEFVPKSLALLDFAEVRGMVESFAAKRNLGGSHTFKQNFAACLMFFTGGHPKCIIDTLEEHYPNPTFINASQNFCYERLRPVIDNLRAQIPPRTQVLIAQLCIVRIWDKVWYTDFLNKLIDNKFVCYNSINQIEWVLQQTQLMSLTEEGKSQRETIFRLFTMMLREEKHERFKNLINRAKHIYREYLQQATHRAHSVAVEALYQELQSAYYQSNQTSQARQDLFNEFFKPDGILQQYLMILLQQNRTCGTLRNFRTILQTPDWEFKFTLNFFLRMGTDYTDGPYRKLLEEVDTFITSNCRGGDHG